MKRKLQSSKSLRPKLVKFLKEHNCLQQFKTNAISYRGTLKYLEDYKDSLSIIDTAFCWSNTPEKHEFWQRLNKEYCQKFDS